MQTIFVRGVFRKLNIDLPINFSQSRFLLQFFIDFAFIDFGGFSFIKFKENRLQRFRIKNVLDLIEKSFSLAKIFFL